MHKIERIVAKFAIKNLMTYIVLLNAVVFGFLYYDTSGVIFEKLLLNPQKVFEGEIWRLITFVFIPPRFDLIRIIFALYFYHLIGSALEQEWGTVKFNMYYILGMLGTLLISLVTGFPGTPMFVNLSLFLAFARVYPNYELLIFYILPVKAKYLAMIDWFVFVMIIIFGSIGDKLIAVIALINYFIFFGFDIFSIFKTNRQVQHNRQKFRSQLPKDFTYHKCTICGRTEKDDAKLEFRYCDKCEGDYEYCMEHIRDHQHILKN
jgi:hypothetical protein